MPEAPAGGYKDLHTKQEILQARCQVRLECGSHSVEPCWHGTGKTASAVWEAFIARGAGAHREAKEGGGGLRIGGSAGHPVLRTHIPLLAEHAAARAARSPPVMEDAVQVALSQGRRARHQLLHSRLILRLWSHTEVPDVSANQCKMMGRPVGMMPAAPAEVLAGNGYRTQERLEDEEGRPENEKSTGSSWCLLPEVERVCGRNDVSGAGRQ